MRLKRLHGLSLLAAVAAFAGCGAPDAPPPEDPRVTVWVTRISEAYERGDLAAAMVLADSAWQVAPGRPELAMARGRIYTAMRRYEQAQQAYAAALAANPSFPGAWYEYGQNAFLRRQYREAIRHYRKEQEVIGEEADAAATAIIEAQVGRAYALLGVTDSARVAYDRALASDSTQASAHAWLSELLEAEGRIGEALHHAQRALVAAPESMENGYRVGQLLLQNERAEEAVAYLKIVASRLPGHEGAALNLGRALQAIGQEAEAQRYLDRVEQLQALQQQAAVAERAVETYPQDAQRWTELAGLMMQIGYLDRAETALNTARALRPDDLSLQSDLANLAFTRGDTTLALQRFEALLRQDSTYAAGWLNLGVVYAVSGDLAAAGRAWRATLRHNPGDPDALDFLDQISRQP